MKARFDGEVLFEQFCNDGERRVVDAERVIGKMYECVRELKERSLLGKISLDDYLSSRINKGAKNRERLDAVKRGLQASGIKLGSKLDVKALIEVLRHYTMNLDDALDQRRSAVKRLPKESVLALWSAIRNIQVRDDELIKKIQKGKCETSIRDRILDALHNQAPNGFTDKNDWAKKEVTIAGKQVDLVLNRKCPKSRLLLECKVAYAGALGTPQLDAPGLTGEADGLFGDILKTRRCSSLAPMGYMLIVPHFKGSPQKLKEVAGKRVAILAQLEERDWVKAVQKRVKSDLRKHPICQDFKVSDESEIVHLGSANGVEVSLQFLLIVQKRGLT